jgi:hypothetical protein
MSWFNKSVAPFNPDAPPQPYVPKKSMFSRSVTVLPYDPDSIENTAPLVQTLVQKLDQDIGLGPSAGKLYTNARIVNLETAVNLVAMLTAIGAGSTVVGVPFIPLIFAISAGIKNFLYSNVTSEEILIISNILHQYVILSSYPSVANLIQYKSCVEQSGTGCVKVTNFATPGKMEGRGPQIFKFLSSLFDEYINQLTKIVSIQQSSKKGRDSVTEIHSICSGVFTTMTTYFSLHGEEPNLAYFDSHPMFTAKSEDVQQVEADAVQVEAQLNEIVTEKIKNPANKSYRDTAMFAFKSIGDNAKAIATGAVAVQTYSLGGHKTRNRNRNRNRTNKKGRKQTRSNNGSH